VVWGLPRDPIVMFENGPAFETKPEFRGNVLASYPKERNPLMSGYLLHPERIQGKLRPLKFNMARAEFICSASARNGAVNRTALTNSSSMPFTIRCCRSHRPDWTPDPNQNRSRNQRQAEPVANALSFLSERRTPNPTSMIVHLIDGTYETLSGTSTDCAASIRLTHLSVRSAASSARSSK
jgi:hypothetical protein